MHSTAQGRYVMDKYSSSHYSTLLNFMLQLQFMRVLLKWNQPGLRCSALRCSSPVSWDTKRVKPSVLNYAKSQFTLPAHQKRQRRMAVDSPENRQKLPAAKRLGLTLWRIPLKSKLVKHLIIKDLLTPTSYARILLIVLPVSANVTVGKEAHICNSVDAYRHLPFPTQTW